MMRASSFAVRSFVNRCYEQFGPMIIIVGDERGSDGGGKDSNLHLLDGDLLARAQIARQKHLFAARSKQRSDINCSVCFVKYRKFTSDNDDRRNCRPRQSRPCLAASSHRSRRSVFVSCRFEDDDDERKKIHGCQTKRKENTNRIGYRLYERWICAVVHELAVRFLSFVRCIERI